MRRALVVIGIVVFVAATTTVALLVTWRGSGSQGTSGGSVAPAPGEYGSDSYYSSDEEEANLGRIGKRVEELGAVGSVRVDAGTMLVRLPSTFTGAVPVAEVLGHFTVRYQESRFTSQEISAIERKIKGLTKADGFRSTFGMSYGAPSDSVHVAGKFSPSLRDSLRRIPEVTVQETTNAGRDTDISR